MNNSYTSIASKLVLGLVLVIAAACGHEYYFQHGSFGFDIADKPADGVPTDSTGDPKDNPTPICDPLDGTGGGSSQNGILSTLTYMRPVPTGNFNVSAFVPGSDNIVQVLNPVYLSSLSKKTSYFTDGFSDTKGNTLKDKDGTPLIEYFALFMKSQIQLASGNPEGDYEFAIISDDGSVMNVQKNGGRWETFIDNDGTHPNRVACSSGSLNLKKGTKVPVEMAWDQGPRTEISLMLFWRTGSSLSVNEPFCGQTFDNQFFFAHGPSQAPTATSNYDAFISRGWKLLAPANFLLPDLATNPCN